MKIFPSRFLSSLALALAWAGAAASAATPAPPPPLILQVDDSPLNDGKSARVTSYADVVEPVQKAVVSIYSSKLVRQRVEVNPLLRQLFGNQLPELDRETKEEGLGSGVIVSADGYILTNNHVVEGADELKVMLSDNREFTAKVIGADQKTDVAVVKIAATNLPTVVLADSDRLRVGDVVFAVGNPLGVGETVTMGIISAKGRSQLGLLEDGGYEDFIQTDAAINMGNSGGALVDAKGRLVGINSAIISPSKGNIGIGFAVPVNLAASVVRSLIATGKVTRGYLGVTTQLVTPDLAEQLLLPKDAKGVIVSDIYKDSPAEKAGLKILDAIVSANGKPVTSTEELRLMVAEMNPGSKLELAIIRNGQPAVVTVILATLAERPNELVAGVDVTRLTADLRRKLAIDPRADGLLVTDVAKDSPYADRLAANMVIMEVNRTPAASLEAVKAVLISPGRNLFKIYYQGGVGYLVLTLK